jgi:hypothetical protein
MTNSAFWENGDVILVKLRFLMLWLATGYYSLRVAIGNGNKRDMFSVAGFTMLFILVGVE